MTPMNRQLLFVFFFCSVGFVFGQERENIGVQEVTVIKSYTPSLQDVFKLRQSPTVIDSIIAPKKEVSYSIFSVPVASTFVPSKGSARKLQPKKKKPQFNSRAAIAFGNLNQLLFDYSSNYSIDRRQKIDWLVNYNGFLRNLEDVQLDSKQSNLLLNVSHQYATTKRNNFSQLNYRQHQQSFYGLRAPIDDAFILQNLDPKQNLNYFSLTSNWQWYEPWVKALKLNTYLTTDAFTTAEAELDFSAKIQTVFGGVALTLLPEFNYLNTQFSEAYYSRLPIDYAVGKGSLSLFASKIRGKFKFKIGATAVYGLGDEFTQNNLFVYPQLALSYLPEKGSFAPFLKVDGDLTLNSFRSFSHENPYVAPAIDLQSSFIPLKAQLGTRSKFFTGWEFQWNLDYQQNKQRPLYRNFGQDIDRQNIIAYRLGNSFEVEYAAITTIGVTAQLSAAFKNGGRMQLKASYADYSFDEETDQTKPEAMTAFNLPQISLAFNGTLKVGQKINFQWLVKHMGERKNAYRDSSFIGQDIQNAPVIIEDLNAFTQIDLSANYTLSERWGIFLKGKNLTNQTSLQWSNYPVFGTQFLLGLRYNFDLAF